MLSVKFVCILGLPQHVDLIGCNGKRTSCEELTCGLADSVFDDSGFTVSASSKEYVGFGPIDLTKAQSAIPYGYIATDKFSVPDATSFSDGE